MVRIAGVNLPEKRVVIALTYIHGIGRSQAAKICTTLKISDNARVSSLNDNDLIRIREFIDANYVVEGELKKKVTLNIKKKMDFGSYQGLRHRRKLPVRGQRTHTNARTRKGKAKPIAGKKK